MTNYPLRINDVDVSDLVHKRGYRTDRQPVYAARFTNLDLVEETRVARYRGLLTISTNDLTAEQAARLAAVLLAPPLQVTYHSFQLGRTVTETMVIEKLPQQLKLQTPRADWIGAVTLSFREV